MDAIIETASGYFIVSANDQRVLRASYEFPNTDSAASALNMLQNGDLPLDLLNFLIQTYEIEKIHKNSQNTENSGSEIQEKKEAIDSQEDNANEGAECFEGDKTNIHPDILQKSNPMYSKYSSGEVSDTENSSHVEYKKSESDNIFDSLNHKDDNGLASLTRESSLIIQTEFVLPQKHSCLILLCGDKKLANKIHKTLGIETKDNHEKYREIREGLWSLLPKTDFKATLAVSHKIASMQVASTDSIDVVVVQLVDLLSNLDEEINSKTMRIKEWYGSHFPEADSFFKDNSEFLKGACIVQNREDFVKTMIGGDLEAIDDNTNYLDYPQDELNNTNHYETLESGLQNSESENKISNENSVGENIQSNDQNVQNLVQDKLMPLLSFPYVMTNTVGVSKKNLFVNKVVALRKELNFSNYQIQKLIALCEMSIGLSIDDIDTQQILKSTIAILELYTYKQKISKFLENRMSILAPNATALVGYTVASKIISKLGSILKCARAPASTLQIVGSEKAFFNAVKNKTNTPKFGHIFFADIVQAASVDRKGAVARSLSTKLALCFRIDCYGNKLKNDIYGKTAKEELAKRLDSIRIKRPKNDIKLKKKMGFDNKLTYDSSKDSQKRRKLA